MRKISEIKGEDALGVLADLIEPFSDIAMDQLMVSYLRSGKKLLAVKHAMKFHPKSILEILAALNEQEAETYDPNLIEIPKMLLGLLNDPDVGTLFQSAETATSSGSATGSTEGAEKM